MNKDTGKKYEELGSDIKYIKFFPNRDYLERHFDDHDDIPRYWNKTEEPDE